MKNFIHCLIITIVLLSCKKKEEEAPKTDKNVGFYQGTFEHIENGKLIKDSVVTQLEITKDNVLRMRNMNFMMINYDGLSFKTGLDKDKLYQKWDNGIHIFTNNTLQCKFVVDEKIDWTCKFEKK